MSPTVNRLSPMEYAMRKPLLSTVRSDVNFISRLLVLVIMGSTTDTRVPEKRCVLLPSSQSYK